MVFRKMNCEKAWPNSFHELIFSLDDSSQIVLSDIGKYGCLRHEPFF